MDNNLQKNTKQDSQLLRALFIFQWIFSLMGLNLPPALNGCTDASEKKNIKYVWICFVIYSLMLVVLVLWVVYINNVIVDVIVENNDLDSITNVLSIGTNISVAIVQVIMQAVAFLKYNNIKVVIKRIAQLERDILLHCRDYQWLQHDVNLNFQHRCQRFLYNTLWRYGIFVIVFSISMCYANYYLVASIMPLRDKLLTLYCTLALEMKIVEYCIFIQIVNEFIASLQSLLNSLKYEIAKSEEKYLMDFLMRKKLMANQFLMNRIWLLVTNIEEYFAMPMLMLFLYNGIVITHTMNWSYVSSFSYTESDPLAVVRLLYIMLLFFNMFMPCWLTQSCIDKYKKLGSILHNLKTKNNLALNNRIREYSLQLRHQEMLFTCAGLFDINLKYFGLMILSIFTYVAILIQFKLQKETEKANVRL